MDVCYLELKQINNAYNGKSLLFLLMLDCETAAVTIFYLNYAGLKKKRCFSDLMQLQRPPQATLGPRRTPLFGQRLGASAELRQPAASVYTGGHVAPLAANTH